MRITEVIKQEVILPDIVKYQGVIIHLFALYSLSTWDTMQEMRDQLQKKKKNNLHACKCNLSVLEYLDLTLWKILIIWNILIAASPESGIKIITCEPSQSLYI